MAELVDKSKLATILGWSRKRLDRTLDRDKSFPIHARGAGKGSAWLFDPDVVLRYLGAESIAKTDVGRDPVSTVKASAPSGNATSVTAPLAHRGEMTARQRRELLQAAILADKLKLARGDLLVKADVVAVFNEGSSGLADFLNAVPDNLVRAFELPAYQREPVRAWLDERRRSFVEQIRRRLQDPGPTPELSEAEDMAS